MKKSFLLVFSCCTLFSHSQTNISPSDIGYNYLKANHLIQNYDVLPSFKWANNTSNQVSNEYRSSSCNCYVEHDTSTYTLAMAPNDDGSSLGISLPFDFVYYGDTITDSIYINNNGNISIGIALPNFSAWGFPSGNDSIVIAPFFGDVDTSPNGGGEVWYKLTSHALIVNWVNVGYYYSQIDKLNTFQLKITDGSGAEGLPPGDNIAFCYKDMEWTTGSASNGINGFGGIPATVGLNKGDGVNYAQIGRFDTSGVNYDGTYGNNDGVSFLDYRAIYFNATSSTNLPPIPIGLDPCDSILINIQDTLIFPTYFLSGESNQTTNVVFNNNGVAGVTEVSNNSGNSAIVNIQVIGSLLNLGYNTVSFTATDNGTPSKTTEYTVGIYVDSNLNVPTNDLYITSASGISEIYINQSEQIITQFLPFDATNQSVTWSVASLGGNANIDQNGNLTGVSAGTVRVTATSLNGSGLSASMDITVLGEALNINKSNGHTIKIYPNPINDNFNIVLNKKVEGFIHLYSIDGKLISSKRIENIKNSINSSHLEKGIFIVKIQLENGEISQHRIIKN